MCALLNKRTFRLSETCMGHMLQVFWILCLPVRCVLRCCGVKTSVASVPDEATADGGVNPNTARPADDNV